MKVITELETIKIRVKATENIFRPCDISGFVGKGVVFDMSVIDLSDISDEGRYYCGMLFFPSIASLMDSKGFNTSTSDRFHC